jgi:hypothetical protein
MNQSARRDELELALADVVRGVTVSHSSPSSPEFPKGLNFTSRNPWSSGEATLRAPKGVVTVAVAAASLICKVHS